MLATFFLAMVPIGELRAAIPYGVADQGLLWWEAYVIAVVGNMIPVFILLWVLDPLSRLLTSFENPAGRFLMWRTTKLRESQGDMMTKWGPLALIPLVAVPLPVTGAWTGCLAAWAFGIDRRRALTAIFVGVLIAAAVVSLIVELSVNFPFVD